MKALKVVKKVLLIFIGVVYFAFALGMTILLLNQNDYGVTEISGNSLVIIDEQISNDKYQKGDLVIVKKTNFSNLNVGDEVFTYRTVNNTSYQVTIGTIGELYPDDEQLAFENGDGFSIDNVLGKATDTYSGIGSFLSVVQSRWGFLFIVLVPCFLIFIYEIYALIVEIKYGAEKEEE